MGEAEIVAAIHRARFLQPRWAATEPEQRRAVVAAILDRIVTTQDELCRLAVHDSGETMLDAMVHEIVPVCRSLAALVQTRSRRRGVERSPSSTRRSPSPGILGFIAPGYLPLRNLILPLAPALLEGSAAVIKVSNRVAWSSLQFAEMVRDVLAEHGHPRELVQVVTGTVESGEALAAAGTDRLMFSGTPETARSVMAAASTSLTPVALEVDVCRPIVIQRDSDPRVALQPALRRVFSAAGQLRGGAPILYVHQTHYDRFVASAARLVPRLRVGHPLTAAVDCGPLINDGRVEALERLLDDAQSQGAVVEVGGRRREDLGPSFFEPTLLTGVGPQMRITEERLLGPVMAVHPFEDLRELPAHAAAAYTPDKELERALRALPLYPARASTYDLLEGAVRAAYGSGLRRRATAMLSVTRHGLADLRARALALALS